MGCTNIIIAQDINITNPSLEGVPGVNRTAPSWIKCGNSPDIQPQIPNYCGISIAASEGKTYAGAFCSINFEEGIAQQLTTPLQAGKTYILSMDLAFPSFYCMDMCYGSCVMYAGDSSSDKAEVLWNSGVFYNGDWKKFIAVFTPTRDYNYISFWPEYYTDICTKKFSGMLIDNLSSLRQVPTIEILEHSSCKGTNTGVAVVNVKEGKGPYTYSWSPGNYTGARISNLSAGTYEVTVTSANGTSVKGEVKIGEYEIKTTAAIINPDCYQYNSGRIRLNTSGGIGPYVYSIDNGNSFQESAVFNNLSDGIYNAVVKDNYDCTLRIDSLAIVSPSPLKIRSSSTTQVSCSDVANGQIIVTVEGGTPPYTYSIPGYVSQQDSIIRHLDEGQYRYRVIDSRDCETEGDAEIIKEWRDCAVFMPNAFSPNGDGVNDVFHAKVHDDITDFRMSIYGRWGELVYQNSNADRGWDGTLKGVSVPGGSYVWVVTYTDSKQQAIKQQGTLVLMR